MTNVILTVFLALSPGNYKTYIFSFSNFDICHKVEHSIKPIKRHRQSPKSIYKKGTTSSNLTYIPCFTV